MARVRSLGRSGYDQSLNPTMPSSDISPPEFTQSGVRTSGASSVNASVATHDKIACRAFELYEQSGREPGRCMQNWAQAEVDLNPQQKGDA